MRLNSISLNNIRSYDSLKIDFEEGRTLLSGDIGAGKSTILIALEFALFGIVKGWNDGEKLLRNGKSIGTVTADIEINGTRIVITRQLKKKNNGIQQGDVIINNSGNEKKITPTEARALILEKLGYPLEYQGKQPLTYRFTVFTPQENMKQIMSENADTRIGIIRKLFSVDKYSRIIENSQVIAKSLRDRISEFKGQIREKPKLVEDINRQKAESESLKKLESAKALELKEYEELLDKKNTEYERILREEANFESSKNALSKLREEEKRLELETKNYQNSASEIKEMIQRQREKARSIILDSEDNETETESCSEGSKNPLEDQESVEKTIINTKDSIAELRQEYTVAEKEKETAESNMNSVKEEMQTLMLHKEKLVQNMQGNIGQVDENTKRIEGLGSKIKDINENINSNQNQSISELREMIDNNSKLLTSLREKSAVLKSENNKMQEELKDIGSMDYCRVCRQKVDDEHKRSIREEYENKISENSSELENLEKKIEEAQENAELLSKNLESYYEAEKKRELQKSYDSQITQLKETIAQKTIMIERIGENIESSKIKISNLQEKLESAEKLVERRKKALSEIMIETEKLRQKEQVLTLLFSNMGKLNDYNSIIKKNNSLSEMKKNEIIVLESELKEYESNRQKYDEEKKKYFDIKRKVRELSDENSKLKERLSSIGRMLKRDLERLNNLNIAEEKKKSLEGVESFITTDMTTLARNIEYAVMQKILVELNGYLQKWFSMMIDDIEVYLDNDFGPVIMQNGYTISYDNLSGGERTSLALAYRLALNETLHDMMASNTTGLLILDEPTEGFSTEQLDAVKRVLDEVNANQLIIVSHEEKMESFVDYIVRVEKSGGLSVINSAANQINKNRTN